MASIGRGYEIVCNFSVVEVWLEIPALFEDILILQDEMDETG
jgi:hypothetical protein